MIEWVIDHLADIPDVHRYIIVTNNKFAGTFASWAAKYSMKHPHIALSIVNDGSTSDEDKRGAIGDIHYVLHHEHILEEDLLVVAGDNLFSESLVDFIQAATTYPATLALYDVGDLESIKKYNNITTDAEGRITHFEEKPANPTSTLTGIALYYYQAQVLPLIDTYIAEGNNPDQPGRLIEWLYPRVAVGTWNVPGTWFDIGSKETLAEANHVFARFS